MGQRLSNRRSMRAVVGRLAAIALGVAVAGFSGCGGDDDDAGDVEAVEGGDITLTQTSQPDSLDPAISFAVESLEALWLVYTPLLTYAHQEGIGGSQLIPGLAEAMPEVSEDGTTYALTLRDGLTYSDGTEVKASDFEHTIKRVLNLESPGTSFFLAIVGAEDYLNAGHPGADLEGIETNDRTGAITIVLNEPNATFSNVLAMTFAGLVPGDTPFENLTDDPPPGVGPYEITESVPNRHFVLEKVEGYSDLGIDGIPTGHVDKMTVEIVKNQTKQAQDVLNNEVDYMQDPPPADFKPTVQEQVGAEGSEEQRYEEFTTTSTYYFFMNHELSPFDDLQVREAVNVGLDRPALARLYGGALAPGCSFLPPGMPGYDEALDTTECPWGDPNTPGDPEAARAMIEDAGAEGADVTVYGLSDQPSDSVTEAYAEQLNEIGLDAEVEILDGGVYFQSVGNRRTAAQTGFTSWFQDFPHPFNFFNLVNGNSIQPSNNPNLGNVDDPEINDEIDRLLGEPEISAVEQDWGDLNKYLVESAAIAPYGHRKLATFVSDRIDFEATQFHPVYQNDYTSFQLKEGSD